MKQAALSRVLGRLAALSIFSLATILAGCSDNTTGPEANNGNPPGSNATVLISDPIPASEADSVRANVRANANDTIVVQLDQAILIALQQINGELLGVKLDYDDEDADYECVVRSGGKIYIVVIDPKTGAVEKKDTTSKAYYPNVIIVRTVPVKVKEAKEKAKKISDGDVVECNLENIDGKATYIVVILTSSNRYVTVFVDAESGKERKLKDDGKCDDEKHKNKKGRGHYRHGKGKGYGHHHHCHCECDDDDDDNDDDDSTQVRDSVITQDSATVIVRTMILSDTTGTDSVTITETKLRTVNDSTAFYDFKIQRDSNRYEVTIDAYTGAFVSIKQTSGDFTGANYKPMVVGDTLVELSVARTAATAQLVGTIESWMLEYDKTDKKWVYTFEIKVTATGEKKRVLVDAKTGQFIRII